MEETLLVVSLMLTKCVILTTDKNAIPKKMDREKGVDSGYFEVHTGSTMSGVTVLLSFRSITTP